MNVALLPFRVCARDLWLALLCAPSELPVGRNQGSCSSLALHTARQEAPSLKGSEVTSSFTPREFLYPSHLTPCILEPGGLVLLFTAP